MFAAGIFLFFLICCGYSCVYTIFIECIALSVFLNSTVFVHDSCFRIKIISLSVNGLPARSLLAGFLIKVEVIAVYFMKSGAKSVIRVEIILIEHRPAEFFINLSVISIECLFTEFVCKLLKLLGLFFVRLLVLFVIVLLKLHKL